METNLHGYEHTVSKGSVTSHCNSPAAYCVTWWTGLVENLEMQDYEDSCPKTIDRFKMLIKHLTSKGQVHNQRQLYSKTFHLVRSTFFYLSALI